MKKTFLLFATLSSTCSLNAETLDAFRDCDVCPEMIELPLGDFMMGAPDNEFRQNLVYREGRFQLATADEPYNPGNEGPQHKVTVDMPIAIGKNEVTFGEWMACVDDGGCAGYVPGNEIGAGGTNEAVTRSLTSDQFNHLPSRDRMLATYRSDKFFLIGESYPVVRISVQDARSYVSWLNLKLGTSAYRLPTEAEWEYAARAGTTTRFAQGFEPTPDEANVSGEATEQSLQLDRPDLRTLPYPVPVEEMDAANQWGIRHMSGNVKEITLSCYTERYQGWSTTSEWLKHSSLGDCARVDRGGAWAFSMNSARVAWRGVIDDDFTRTQYTGFRVVKDLK